MRNFVKISTYYGISDQYAKDLTNGKVDTLLGGGELGERFYLGTALHVANAWAMKMHDSESVIEFKINDDDF